MKRKKIHIPETPELKIKQKRSRKTYDALIKTAFRLLKTRQLSSISVAELTREAGYSVGAFYARFESKDEFLEAMLDHHHRSRRASHAYLFSTYTGGELIDRLLEDLVTYILKNRGFWQTCLIYSVHDPDFWKPMRALGHEVTTDIINRLSGERNRKLTEREKLNIGFAFQVTFGTINNTIINQPGPVEMKDPLFIDQLIRTFKLVSDYENITHKKRAGKRAR